MFETHDTGRRHSLFSALGEYFWNQVGLPLHMPWFFVTYTVVSEEGIAFSQSLMLCDVNQLVDLAQREDIKLEFVDLVSPNYMNGSGRWKMEPLHEIWIRNSDKEPEQYEHEFVLENGTHYSVMAAPPDDRACFSRLIFQI